MPPVLLPAPGRAKQFPGPSPATSCYPARVLLPTSAVEYSLTLVLFACNEAKILIAQAGSYIRDQPEFDQRNLSLQASGVNSDKNLLHCASPGQIPSRASSRR
jgi:hypothetical protein